MIAKSCICEIEIFESGGRTASMDCFSLHPPQARAPYGSTTLALATGLLIGSKKEPNKSAWALALGFHCLQKGGKPTSHGPGQLGTWPWGQGQAAAGRGQGSDKNSTRVLHNFQKSSEIFKSLANSSKVWRFFQKSCEILKSLAKS